MKKNAKKIAAILLAAVTALTVVGCTVEKTVTTTETHTDADGNTTTTTTTEKTDENGTTTTTETTVGGKTYAVVPKSAGNPFNEKEVEGFKEVIEAAGGTCVVNYPEEATADAQITVINSLISQGVDAIAVAANDANALQAVLMDAMDAGIKVSTFDSDAAADARMTFANQAGVSEIGQALCDAVLDISGGEGQWAIVSATSQATNQNAWIESMKEIMASDAKYAGLELVDIQYGDDEPELSTTVTQALLANYPDLKVICAPTTVGIAAAAKVLQDAGSSCKLTGLGLPSEMAEYIGDDDAHSCPYMYLWNPIDLGRLAAYISLELVDGNITGAIGDTFSCDLADYELTDNGSGASQVILGQPFAFTPENINEWKVVY